MQAHINWLASLGTAQLQPGVRGFLHQPISDSSHAGLLDPQLVNGVPQLLCNHLKNQVCMGGCEAVWTGGVQYALPHPLPFHYPVPLVQEGTPRGLKLVVMALEEKSWHACTQSTTHFQQGAPTFSHVSCNCSSQLLVQGVCS